MTDDQASRQAVDHFIVEQIDSVPQLEALLLLWRNSGKAWTAEEMGRMLYIRRDAAEEVLKGLVRRGLITSEVKDQYVYSSESEELNKLLKDVDTIYRKELIRVSNMIHSNAPASVREFARAFRFTKERE